MEIGLKGRSKYPAYTKIPLRKIPLKEIPLKEIWIYGAATYSHIGFSTVESL
jgi:hypothetical protein